MNKPLKKIAIIGLGYVGLPLAVEFGKKRPVIGFDINTKRIEELKNNKDNTLELGEDQLLSATNLKFTSSLRDLENCQIYIVTVPTPIDSMNVPDLSLLKSASEMIGGLIKQGDLVIYESTVYPGATEEVCIPIIEDKSGFIINKDFHCGYSPERINPGDKEHSLSSIIKVTSGSNDKAAQEVDEIYSSIIAAGTHKAKSIKIAEAAKVIENTQRDLNIALMNELSIIFQKLDIDTMEVIEAAKTKWNFLPFTPGLVGGHCIGVDPYYLTHKAQQVGYEPKVILAGRKINDGMSEYISETLKLELNKNYDDLSKTKILVLGLSFKENCPDIRNSKVVDIIKSLESDGVRVDTYDPWIDPVLAKSEYNVDCLLEMPASGSYDAILIAVGHKEFTDYRRKDLTRYIDDKGIIFDVKSILPSHETDLRL